jgi:Ca2+-binding RTX toxin-like protein
MARINGTEDDDILTGGAGDDIIEGNGGNDRIDGGQGADWMEGGDGNDTYEVDDAGDTVQEIGGSGVDTVNTTLGEYALTAYVEKLFYTGTSVNGFRGTGNALSNEIRGGAHHDILDGGAGSDTMIGYDGHDTYVVDDEDDMVVEQANAGTDWIRTSLTHYVLGDHFEFLSYTGSWNFTGVGNALDNMITGGEGDDELDGGAGADTMEGGAGNDIYWVDQEGDQVSEWDGEGDDDLINTSLTAFVLVDNVEGLVFTGTGNVAFHGTGNALDNLIYGGIGNDVLDGAGGIDLLMGKAGDDRYIVDNAGDMVIEFAGEGVDRVDTTLAAFGLASGVEQLFFTGAAAAAFHGTGNELDNRIESRGGNDRLDGGAGADTLVGGAGDDIYLVDHGNDTVVELAGEGADQIETTLASFALGANLERLVYVGTGNFQGTGNGLANYLQGGGGNDRLDGGLGADEMAGGGGDDEYIVDNANDWISEGEGRGNDIVKTGLAAYTLAANVERLAYTGPQNLAFAGTGNALDNQISGGGYNDTLNGGAGADTMTGFTGHDNYYVDNVGDVIVEAAGQGADRVYTTLSTYTLPANVEDLIMINPTSGIAFHAIGNALNNYMYGGVGHDEFEGGAGADHMVGHSGNDIYWVDDAGDRIDEKAGDGLDTVKVTTLASYTLGATLERLVFVGAGNFSATGNAAVNHLETGAGNDRLDGGGGADTMIGGGGDDIYVVDEAGDTAVEAAGEGIDAVETVLAAYSLGANIENLAYRGAAGIAFAGTGNALANRIEGGSGNDTIDGGLGADTMIGLGGNDLYFVDDAADAVQEQFGGGVDEVRTAIGSRSDFSRMYILAANVENLTGTSVIGQGVYGNGHDNLIRMGSGGDLIVVDGGGNDTVQSGGGKDFIYFGAAFTAEDCVDGGAGFDTVGLLGNYTLAFAAGSLAAVEKLAVYSSGSGGAAPAGYDLVMADGNVAAGAKLMVVAQSLAAAETLTFNGSAESDGSFNIRGGKGSDSIVGGAGADIIWGNLGADVLRGGAGKDLFEYDNAAESTAAARDTILDFAPGDRINLSGIDADGNAANGNGQFAFIGAGAFTKAAGQLRAVQAEGNWLIEGDTNGDGAADLSILVTAAPGHLIGAADFIL